MFIVTNIDLNIGMIQVLDTKDGTDEIVSLDSIAKLVRAKKLKIAGLGVVGKTTNLSKVMPIYNYGIYLDPDKAKSSLDEYYKKLRRV